ncbi:hypothetical protein QBC34DRAFT_456109 [Podospora aff. communis PSN243]|uniref:Kelch repeat protein n=1 Tax=Podospora aff. communis PSN243 TaxID=3040156 RepID=A0AAV9G2W0_9PEZI|nr:hypothetical protein QBC34DRAFT_456109 [Podospora aff. communis PSN243]
MPPFFPSGAVFYTEPVDDPIFSANVPLEGYDPPRWAANKSFRLVACLDQYMVCNDPTDGCGTWQSLLHVSQVGEELVRSHEDRIASHVLTFGKTGPSPFSPINTIAGAAAEYLPLFGPSGLVMVLGGHEPDVGADPDFKLLLPLPLDNITLFDPKSMKRYWQLATGDIPSSPRSQWCTASFANPEGGYGIFLFGGDNWRDKFRHEDAYVLSLPGFFWKRLPDSPAGTRYGHTCVAAGKRQVLSAGGVNSKEWEEKDPAPLGLQVFDMTRLVWKDDYDAEAAEGFLSRMLVPPPPGPSTESTESSIPVGAIVGGAVGGVVGLGVIGAIVWWLLRKRRSRQRQEGQPEEQVKPELHADSAKNYVTVSPSEIDPSTPHRELPTAGVHQATQRYIPAFDLDGGYQR